MVVGTKVVVKGTKKEENLISEPLSSLGLSLCLNVLCNIVEI